MEYLGVLKPWYAYNGAMHRRGSRVAPFFQELYHAEPMFGYYPEVDKSIAICLLGNQPCLKAMFLEADLKVKWRRGHRYMGDRVRLMAMLSR